MMLRIRFQKTGSMKYIGHLDVMRYFQKLNRRAGIDVAYSEGFSPHQIMSFAQPLGVGLLGNGEYLDLEVCSAESSEAVKEAMNAVQAEGMWVTDVVRLPDRAPNAMASVAWAVYTVRLREDPVPVPRFSPEEIGEGKERGEEAVWSYRVSGKICTLDLGEEVRSFLSESAVLIQKETKKGFRELDLKPLVPELALLREEGEEGDKTALRMRLCASSGNNVKPGLVIRTLCDRAGVEPPLPRDLLIAREDLCDGEGRPLLMAGTYF